MCENKIHIKRSKVVSLIREDILSRQTLIRQEINVARLAEAHRISLTPVREALFQLLGEGLIELLPHKGFSLRPINLTSTKSSFTVIQSIIEHKFRTSKNLSVSEEPKIVYFESQQNIPSRLSFMRDFYAFLLATPAEVEQKDIVDKLYLRTALIRSKILGDDVVWNTVFSQINDINGYVKRNDPVMAMRSFNNLYAQKYKWIDNTFKLLAVEFLSEE